ncbi:unnamed protein product [Clonostachys solani]|uniref:Heterokaryon incompatibility domain-containing protein n=1 Tax=Clonostachys solani TaxID=160281 RepID=A0A9P0ENP3_9HYPO|nr:unnamed protein product [Clonostachys solani]
MDTGFHIPVPYESLDAQHLTFGYMRMGDALTPIFPVGFRSVLVPAWLDRFTQTGQLCQPSPQLSVTDTDAAGSLTADAYDDAPVYQYSPLETPTSIRMFRLIGCDAKTRSLVGTFMRVDLAAAEIPPYEALSYTWGAAVDGEEEDTDEKPWQVLICDSAFNLTAEGLEQVLLVSSLPIGSNAASYLRAVVARHEMRGATLNHEVWIDALCIDQANAEEKKIQIPLMGQLYFKANMVVAWLGQSTSHWNEFSWLHHVMLPALWDAIESGIVALRADTDPTDPEFWATRLPSLTPPGGSWSAIWESYWRFLDERRWFRRAWTYQETILAKKLILVCGIEFNNIALEHIGGMCNTMHHTGWRSILTVRYSGWSEDNPCKFLMGLVRTRDNILQAVAPSSSESKSESSTEVSGLPHAAWLSLWTEVCVELRSRQCGFQEDKINATLGIASLLRPPQIPDSLFLEPSGLDASKAYRWMSYQLICQAGSPRFMSFAGPPSSKKVNDLPSWAADFSSVLRSTTVCQTYGDSPFGHRIFNAGQALAPDAKNELVIDGNKLVVDGARVTHFRPRCVCGLNSLHETYLEMVLRMPSRYAQTSQSSLEAIRETLVWDHSTDVAPIDEAWGQEFASWLEARFSLGCLLPSQPDHPRKNTFLPRTQEEWWTDSQHLICRAREAGSWDAGNPAPSLEAIQATIDEIQNHPAWHAFSSEQHSLKDDTSWLNFFDRVCAAIPRFKATYHLASWSDLAQRFRTTFHNRLAFLTESGYLGLCSIDVLDTMLASPDTDAEIWILHRGPVPYVLMPEPNTTNTFIFQGDCYIHGAMYGEWKPLPDESMDLTINEGNPKSWFHSKWGEAILEEVQALSVMDSNTRDPNEASAQQLRQKNEEVIADNATLHLQDLKISQTEVGNSIGEALISAERGLARPRPEDVTSQPVKEKREHNVPAKTANNKRQALGQLISITII